MLLRALTCHDGRCWQTVFYPPSFLFDHSASFIIIHHSVWGFAHDTFPTFLIVRIYRANLTERYFFWFKNNLVLYLIWLSINTHFVLLLFPRCVSVSQARKEKEKKSFAKMFWPFDIPVHFDRTFPSFISFCLHFWRIPQFPDSHFIRCVRAEQHYRDKYCFVLCTVIFIYSSPAKILPFLTKRSPNCFNEN